MTFTPKSKPQMILTPKKGPKPGTMIPGRYVKARGKKYT